MNSTENGNLAEIYGSNEDDEPQKIMVDRN